MGTALEFIIERYDEGASEWQFVPNAVCEQSVINAGAKPSTARIKLVGNEWQDSGEMKVGDQILVRTAEDQRELSTIIFYGTITAITPSFSSDTGSGGSDECSRIYCQCPKYSLSNAGNLDGTAGPIYGQWGYAKSAYSSSEGDWAGGPPQPTDTSKIFHATGRRCVFNADGQPDRGQNKHTKSGTDTLWESYLFDKLDPEYWTIKDIVEYIIVWGTDYSSDLAPQHRPEYSPGIGFPPHEDFFATPNNVVVETLSPVEALEYVANLIGWKYRLDWCWSINLGKVLLYHVFYRPGEAVEYTRNNDHPAVIHSLYSPSLDDSLSGLVSDDNINLVAAGNLILDSGNVVNKSISLGENTVYEATFELVPAWGDADFVSWIFDGDDKLFYDNSEIADLLKGDSDPDDKTYYTSYHVLGSDFNSMRNVGRKWALNEKGDYTSSDYDRGMPFDFATVLTGQGLSNDSIGYWPRLMSECLATDAQGNPIKYAAEFSVDGGESWHALDCRIEILTNEFGIYISEPNLCEIKIESDTDEGAGLVFGEDGGDTDGQEINYFTSLYRDLELERSFKDGEWHTLIRVTASLQLDERLISTRDISGSGTSMAQVALYDMTERFLSRKQTSSSKFYGSAYYNVDDRYDLSQMEMQQVIVDETNKMPLYSGSFILEKIAAGDGDIEGDWFRPRFMVGDCITEIEGRGLSLKLSTRTSPEPYDSARTYASGQKVSSIGIAVYESLQDNNINHAPSEGEWWTDTGDSPSVISRHACIEQIIYRPEFAQIALVTADLRRSDIG